MTVLLLKSQLRFGVRHPVGSAASIVGVTVAVLAVVTVHLVGHSIRDDLDDFSIAGHTHVATPETRDESRYFELRRRWRGSDPAPEAGSRATGPDWARSVVAMFPVIEGYVEIQGQPRRIVGLDPVAASGLGGGALTASRPDTDYDRFMIDDAVMASSATARDIAAAGGLIAGFPVDVLEAATAVILADLPTAQRLLGRENEIDAVWLRLADARSRLLDWLDQLLPGIAASLPRYTDPVIDGYEVTAANRWNPSRRFADAILFNLGMLSLLCLLMAAFIAFQASASNAARRRTEHERLLAIGASRSTLKWVSGVEGLAIGVVGAVAGLALGFVVADELLHAALPEPTATTPDAAPDDRQALALDGWVVGKSLACGVLASAFGPLAEGRFAKNARLRLGLALVALAVAAIGLVDGALGAAYVALAAICAVHVVYVVPLAGSAAGPLARLGRSLASRANLRGTAARSSEIRLALGALSVAAAVAIGMGLMVESLRRDFTEMLDVRLAHGIYVQTASDVSQSELDALREMEGVREARRYGDVSARARHGPVAVRIAELDAYEIARYGLDGTIGRQGMINEVGARLIGMGPGDVVDLVVAGRSVPVEIAHVFRDFGAAAPRVILPMSFLTELGATSVSWRRVAVRANPGAARKLTATLGERYGADRVSNHDDIRAAAVAVFDRTFVVSRSLAAMALVVAAIGLYAALTSLQTGRSREFRLLSAVGHTRAELWRLALSQTVVLGATALIAALPLGLAIAWVLCDFVNPAAFGWSINLRVDVASITGPLLLGVLAACAAGALPAYRVAFRGTP